MAALFTAAAGCFALAPAALEAAFGALPDFAALFAGALAGLAAGAGFAAALAAGLTAAFAAGLATALLAAAAFTGAAFTGAAFTGAAFAGAAFTADFAAGFAVALAAAFAAAPALDGAFAARGGASLAAWVAELVARRVRGTAGDAGTAWEDAAFARAGGVAPRAAAGTDFLVIGYSTT
ncbi:hypothetical protein [Massilia sp. GCM10023247]|uniref:hypothetical protein n=1 Tax=Massilia sp. GCM10023247 TaxID=3252643 RepID=UPI00360E2A13